MVHLPQTNFFWKINIFFDYTVPFTVQNFKTILPVDQEFLVPKWAISPNENFFRKPVNEPCFFHSSISTCQKSKSDVNLFVKYWQLKNTEIFLSTTWEPDFSQACSFCRMLIDHMNFQFTQISDKTNNVIFLKSPKTMFW